MRPVERENVGNDFKTLNEYVVSHGIRAVAGPRRGGG